MRFEKGNPGGPGRPKKVPTLGPTIREILSDPVRRRQFAEAMIVQAEENGNAKAIERVFYAMDCPVEQRLTIDQMMTSMTVEEKLQLLLRLEAERAGMDADNDDGDGE